MGFTKTHHAGFRKGRALNSSEYMLALIHPGYLPPQRSNEHCSILMTDRMLLTQILIRNRSLNPSPGQSRMGNNLKSGKCEGKQQRDHSLEKPHFDLALPLQNEK